MENNKVKKMGRRGFLKYMGVLGIGAMTSPLLTACSSAEKQISKTTTTTISKKPMEIKLPCSYVKDQMRFKEMGAWKFKELVEQYSNGEVVVKIYESEQLGSHRDVALKIQAGAIELGHISAANTSQFVPELNLLDLPYIFPSKKIAYEFFQDPYSKELFYDPMAKKGFRNCWWTQDGDRIIGFNHKIQHEIYTPADLKGIKVRVTGSAMEQKAFALAGASPVPMAWGECYTGLQQGIIDAIHVGMPALHAAGYGEIFNSVCEPRFGYNTEMTVASQKWWDTLDQDHKDLFNKCFAETEQFCFEKKAGAEEEVRKIWQEELNIKFFTPNQTQLEEWIKVIGHQNPAYDEFKEQFGKEYAQKIMDFCEERK